MPFSSENIASELLTSIHKPLNPGGPSIFRSQRFNKYLFYQRQDDNIFFPAVTAFTLQNLRQFLNADQQDKTDAICKSIIEQYHLYRNKDGLNTYNFWKTKPTRHFPNGYILSKFMYFKLPDDIDDTAMIYLTSQQSSDHIHWLKDKLVKHANTVKRKIKNTHAKYQHLKAYSTWFGKNMCIEFDVCVLCNLFYLICEHKMKWNEFDLDTIRFLGQVIENDHHINQSFRVSPEYTRTSIILYHYTRLISRFKIKGMEHLKEKLIEDLYRTLSKAKTRMESIILSTSLLRFDQKPPIINVSDYDNIAKERFPFFRAAMLAAFENPIARSLAKLSLFQLHFRNESYYKALILEYLILTKNS